MGSYYIKHTIRNPLKENLIGMNKEFRYRVKNKHILKLQRCCVRPCHYHAGDICGNVFMGLIGFEKHALRSTTNMISGNEMPPDDHLRTRGSFYISNTRANVPLRGKKDELELNDMRSLIPNPVT